MAFSADVMLFFLLGKHVPLDDATIRWPMTRLVSGKFTDEVLDPGDFMRTWPPQQPLFRAPVGFCGPSRQGLQAIPLPAVMTQTCEGCAPKTA
jgi:hypothetical protein